MKMTDDDILKLKAVALYILMQCGETDFIHLFKILYFSERNHYAQYGKHLIKDTFCALERGPVPSFLYDAVKVATGTASASKGSLLEELAKAFKPGEAECRYMICAAEKPDMDELSRAEISIMDEAIKQYLPLDARSLSQKSHDIAWKKAWEKRHSSPMSASLIAQAGGATQDFIDYIEEQEQINKYLAE